MKSLQPCGLRSNMKIKDNFTVKNYKVVILGAGAEEVAATDFYIRDGALHLCVKENSDADSRDVAVFSQGSWGYVTVDQP